MNTKSITRIIVIFVALSVAGIALLVLGLSAAELQVRLALPLIGGALFSSALTYFLLEMSRIFSEK